MGYVSDNDVLSDHLVGFKEKRSTTDARLKFMNPACANLDFKLYLISDFWIIKKPLIFWTIRLVWINWIFSLENFLFVYTLNG